MNDNDMLPEEQDPEFAELITLLRQADLKSPTIDQSEQEQLIANARDRLFPIDHQSYQQEHMSALEMQKLDFLQSKSNARVDKQYRGGRRVYIIFNTLAAVLVVVTLIGWTLFITKFSLLGRTGTNPIKPISCNTTPNGMPSLMLSTNTASSGSTVTGTLNHFAPSSRVILTHDIQEPLLINGSSSITTDARGCATFTFVVDTTWGPGFHLLVAKDTRTHTTASANLQVTGFSSN